MSRRKGGGPSSPGAESGSSEGVPSLPSEDFDRAQTTTQAGSEYPVADHLEIEKESSRGDVSPQRTHHNPTTAPPRADGDQGKVQELLEVLQEASVEIRKERQINEDMREELEVMADELTRREAAEKTLQDELKELRLQAQQKGQMVEQLQLQNQQQQQQLHQRPPPQPAATQRNGIEDRAELAELRGEVSRLRKTAQDNDVSLKRYREKVCELSLTASFAVEQLAALRCRVSMPQQPMPYLPYPQLQQQPQPWMRPYPYAHQERDEDLQKKAAAAVAAEVAVPPREREREREEESVPMTSPQVVVREEHPYFVGREKKGEKVRERGGEAKRGGGGGGGRRSVSKGERPRPRISRSASPVPDSTGYAGRSGNLMDRMRRALAPPPKYVFDLKRGFGIFPPIHMRWV